MGCGSSVATPTADPKKKRNSVAPSVLDPKKKNGFARMISIGSGGHKFVVKNGVPGQDDAALSMFTSLHLDTIAVNDFFTKFKEIDLDNSNQISLSEFYDHFQMVGTPFTKRAFTLMDVDSSGQINFSEFVSSIWNYCSFDDSMMIDFAFKVYDIDASDSLSYSEMYHLVKEVYGIQPKGSLEPRVAQLMEKMGVGSGTSGGGKVSMETFSGKVSLERFTSFNAQFPMLLMPAYLLQQNLRKLTFGEVYWTAVSKQRVEFTGRNTNVFELMGEHGKEYIMSMAKGAKSGSHKIKSYWVRRTVDKLTTLDDSSSGGGTKAMTLTPKGKKAASGAGSISPRMTPGQFKRQDSSRGGDAFGDSTAEPQHSTFKPTL